MRVPQFLRWCLFAGSALVLVACGGGSGIGPSVSAIQAQTLQYGRTATLYVAGSEMRNDMVADTGAACTSPSFAASSTSTVAVLNCTVTAVGDLPITIKAANGDVLYRTTLSVPKPQVTLITPKGGITLELEPGVAPVTVNNFLGYVRSGFYTNTLFHRVIAGFVIQAGGYTTGLVKKEGQGAPIVLESNRGLSNLRGTVAMARTSEPNSATSEFFVNLVDNVNLDYQSDASPGYAVFGRVVQGLDVVAAIAAEPTTSVGGFNDVPTTEVPITLVLQLK